MFRIQPDPHIFHRNHDAVGFVKLRPDAKHTRPVGDRTHGVDGVRDQIEQDLLKLHRVADDQWQSSVQFGLDGYAVEPYLAPGVREHLLNKLVYIQWNPVLGALSERHPDAFDDLGGAMTVTDNAFQRRL